MNKLTKSDLNQYMTGLTVGKLKKFITDNNLSDDSLVLIQRVEDRYYDGIDISGMSGCKETDDGKYPSGSKSDGWGVYLKEGDSYYRAECLNNNMINELKNRECGAESDYPDLVNPENYITELVDELKEQYHPAWSCVYYKDDPDVLFIDLHY